MSDDKRLRTLESGFIEMKTRLDKQIDCIETEFYKLCDELEEVGILGSDREEIRDSYEIIEEQRLEIDAWKNIATVLSQLKALDERLSKLEEIK